jgi:4,5-DOPA dioxygenase extradiol
MSIMDSAPLPPIFVSHGSPMIALEPREAGAFMARLGPAIDRAFGRPRAILAISAHTLARAPVLLGASRHEAVYDFGGFDDRLYRMRYDAPGAPALADEVHARLQRAGIDARRTDDGGLDHGIWTALRYVYPAAGVPVLPLAFVPTWSPRQLFGFGAALAALAPEGVLVVGTGSITHNLRRVFEHGLRGPADRPEIPESAAFRDWFVQRSAARDWDALFDYRALAPHAVDMHPTDEHLLPWYVAAGAGGTDDAQRRLHASQTHGCLGMDAYAFGPQAARLEAALAEAALPA